MRLCIFCGSSRGHDPVYADTARAVATALALSGHEIVYGGGRVGLMGVVADAALAAGGRVTGVIPLALQAREVGHTGLTELHVVDTMHERKQRMADLSDAFIALPGGAGTLDEIFEQWTWGQLGIHAKPSVFLNINGYYTPLRTFLSHVYTEGFTRPELRDILTFADDLDTLLTRIRDYQPPPRKWGVAAATVRP